MSPNNLILVAHTPSWSYVFVDVNADTQWSIAWARAHIRYDSANDGPRASFKKRERGLLWAHNRQLRLKTEYGVREVFLYRRGGANSKVKPKKNM